MSAPHPPRAPAARAVFALLALASAVAADSIPTLPMPTPVSPPLAPPLAQPAVSCPQPAAPCPQPAAPCPQPAAPPCPQPRIVVNVPPPEIVYQDVGPFCRTPCLHPKWNLFHRRGPVPVQGGAQTQTVTFAPLHTVTTGQSFALLNGAGLNFGAANFGGFGLANVNPGFATQVGGFQQMPAAAPSGLAAIHQAELYAASVNAARAQQDAELRMMLAALDRARGSMAASTGGTGVAGGAGACPELSCDAIKAMVAATTENNKQIVVLAQQIDLLQTKLNALAGDVAELKKVQAATILELKKLQPATGAGGMLPPVVIPPAPN